MKIAVCVLAQRAPRILAAAARAYRAMDWDIIVHLDAKSDFRLYWDAAGWPTEGCHFLPNRIPVFWSGMSQVEAQFLMFDKALADGADRIVYVTDDSMPVQPLAHIAAMVKEPVERIHANAAGPQHPQRLRYENIAIFDHPGTNPRADWLRYLDADFFALAAEANGLRLIGKRQLPVYWGFAYRVSTAPVLREVMRIMREDPLLWASFKFSVLPEEMFMPMIINHYLPGTPMAQGPMLMEFPNGAGPKVYKGPAELPEVIDPEHLFGRKFSAEAGAWAEHYVNHLITGWHQTT